MIENILGMMMLRIMSFTFLTSLAFNQIEHDIAYTIGFMAAHFEPGIGL